MLNGPQSLDLAALDPISTFAHELSNPLSLIQVNLELLEQTLTPAAFMQVKKYIHRAKNGVAHAHRIVHYAKHQCPPEQRDIIKLAPTLEALVTNYQQRLEQAQINLILELEPKLCIRGEQSRLTMIFDNLLRNSIEAFAGYIKSPKAIKIEAGKRRDLIIVRISDNGRGMSAENQKFIFDYGFTTKGAQRGKGLAIVIHNLYSHFDGQIDFVSGESEGTIFELVFHAAT